jgi:hypothetical protein
MIARLSSGMRFFGALSDGVESFAKCHQVLPEDIAAE